MFGWRKKRSSVTAAAALGGKDGVIGRQLVDS